MRLAYSIAALVILTAAFVTWRYLLAPAPAEPAQTEQVDLALTDVLLGAEA